MKITVNGQEYASWDDVPDETRALLERVLPDDDHNGTPDLFEGKGEPGQQFFRGNFVTTKKTVNTRVPRTATHPGFSFTMTETTDQAVPPQLPDECGDELPDEFREVSPPAPAAPDIPILLNGEPIGADGQPLAKKRRWRR